MCARMFVINDEKGCTDEMQWVLWCCFEKCRIGFLVTEVDGSQREYVE